MLWVQVGQKMSLVYLYAGLTAAVSEVSLSEIAFGFVADLETESVVEVGDWYESLMVPFGHEVCAEVLALWFGDVP